MCCLTLEKIIFKDFFVCNASNGEKPKLLKFWYWLCFDVLTQGCENVDSINLALYCPWIILFKKGTYKTLSKTSKIKKTPCYRFHRRSLKIFIAITNKQISKNLSPKHPDMLEVIMLWWKNRIFKNTAIQAEIKWLNFFFF